jgi:hypothetical protein
VQAEYFLIVLPSEGLALIGRPKRSPGGIDLSQKKSKADVNRFGPLIETGKQQGRHIQKFGQSDIRSIVAAEY